MDSFFHDLEKLPFQHGPSRGLYERQSCFNREHNFFFPSLLPHPFPPFTLHTDPVVYVFRSEHKNSITSATSAASE